MPMKRRTAAMAAVLALSLATPGSIMSGAMAAEDKKDAPGELALEGLTTLMEALEAFVDSIPQYEAPEILPNGDIIIRRKNGRDGKPPASDEDATEL